MLDILYEDNHIIAVNKKPAEIVQSDKTGDTPLSEDVKIYIKNKYNKPGEVFLGVVHRIDRPVSGVVVFAKTSKALTRLNVLFQNHEIEKTYWAIVQKRPANEQGTLINYLKKNSEKNITRVYDKEVKESKRAELSYLLLLSFKNYHLLEIHPKTGRSHQIRSQLSHIGSPIKGDIKYGSDRTNADGSIHLHARSIKFIHPITKIEIIIKASPPNDQLWNSIKLD